MMSRRIGRRHFALSAAASIAAAPALGQAQSPAGPLDPRAAGRFHTDSLVEAREALKGNSAIDAAGLKSLVDLLARNKVISSDAAVALKEFIDQLWRSQSTGAIVEVTQSFANKLPGNAEGVVMAIAQIARSSADFINNELKNLSLRQALLVISSDLQGAFSGAVAGYKLGPAWAIAGAVIGASSSSIAAAFGRR